MSCEMSCAGCGKACGSCGGCGGGLLTLTAEQAAALQCFSAVPFLPVARNAHGMPVYFDETGQVSGDALLALAHKELIQIDYMIPLQGCDYTGYEAYSTRGSMALTLAGQEIIEQLDIQEIEA